MCEFCLKHGEGKTWYLQAKNYSDDLLADVQRRKFIEEFVSDTKSLEGLTARLEQLQKAPRLVQSLVKRLLTRKMKRVHFGQVLPIEEVERIFEFVNSVTRVACICRHVTLGKEKRYCYGISMGPNGGKFAEIVHGVDKSFLSGPAVEGMEVISKEEAIAALRSHEREGLCHTVWTFHAPFIGGICNCDRSDCLAMRCTVTHDLPVMFRAEFVARVNQDGCVGCRECMRVCQFGAIAYSASDKKVVIDQRWCYGCGICRSVCKKNAIILEERANTPIAAKLW